MSLRDTDSAETAFRMRAFAYGLMVGALGGGAGFLIFGKVAYALLSFVVVGTVVYFASLLVAEHGGRVGAAIYQPTGSSTPAVREYSHADSLVARGQYAEAVEAYRQLAVEYPADPEPRLRQARVLRDHHHAFEDAVTVFRQVLQMAALRPETELAVLRELVELCIQKQQQPQRALPYLARITEKFSGTSTAAWARREAREIKDLMQRES